MSIIWAIIFLLGGLVILWRSACLLVGGAAELAERLGISPLIIGLTVVAMGTSAPEVAASIAAAVRGAGNVAIGNVYGSNIANLALVGGLCALIRPIRVQLRTLRREMPVMLAVALLLWPVVGNLYLSRLEGFVLLGVFAALILLTVYSARKDKRLATGNTENTEKNDEMDSRLRGNDKKSGNDKSEEEILRCAQNDKGCGNDIKTGNDIKSGNDIRNTQYAILASSEAKARNTKKSVLFVVIGLAGLALGADITVRGGVFIGEHFGLSKAVIGLTIIAVGTSLPELVTCVVAATKGQDDISIGIMVGSNVFNALLAIGAAGLIRPFEVAGRLAGVDYWIMVIISAGFGCMALIGRRIGRADGTLLLCGYIAYMVYLLAYTRAI